MLRAMTAPTDGPRTAPPPVASVLGCAVVVIALVAGLVVAPAAAGRAAATASTARPDLTFGTGLRPWSEAWAVAASPSGDLYVADRTPPRIFKVAAGTSTPVVYAGTTAGSSGDGGPATSAQLDFPAGLVVDPATGDLFISDLTSGRVRRVAATTGTISTVAVLRDPAGLAVLGRTLYVARYSDDLVTAVDLTSGATSTAVGSAVDAPMADGTGTAATLDEPWGLAAGPDGALYIADARHHAVRRFDPSTGAVTTPLGASGAAPSTPTTDASRGDGGPAGRALLVTPSGVAFDAAGDLLVGDVDDRRVRRVDATTGTVSTVAGTGASGPVASSGPGLAGSVSSVASIAVTPDDVLVVGNLDAGSAAVAVLGAAAAAPATATATATVGAPVAAQLTATGTPVLRWTTAGGSLPPGLALSPTGVLSGTPLQPGTWTATVLTANGFGSPASTALTVVVAPAPSPPAAPQPPVVEPAPGLQRWGGAGGAGGASVDASSHLLAPGRASAVLVSADAPADGVAGAVLAARTISPLLLLDPAGLTPAAAGELRRALAPGARLAVVGGPAAVPDAVLAQVLALGAVAAPAAPWTVERVAGADRAETAAAVGRALLALGADGPVLVADGRTTADGAAAVPWAVAADGIVLLSDGARTPRPTLALLQERTAAGAPLVPVGGPARAAVAGIAEALGPAGPAALAAAVVGVDRYDTCRLAGSRAALAVAQAVGSAGAVPAPTSAAPVVALADGDAGGQAVVAAWAAAVLGGRLLLVPPAGLDDADRAALLSATGGSGAGAVLLVGPGPASGPGAERSLSDALGVPTRPGS